MLNGPVLKLAMHTTRLSRPPAAELRELEMPFQYQMQKSNFEIHFNYRKNAGFVFTACKSAVRQ